MNVTKKLYLLIFIIVVGFLSLISLNSYFNSLMNRVDEEQKNYLAKLQIADFISYDINKMYALFSKLMIYANNERIKKRTRKDVSKKVNELLDALKVLQNGGSLKRKIYLNLVDENSDAKYINSITKDIEYKKTSSEIPIAVISLMPKIKQLNSMAEDINKMLKLQSKYKKNSTKYKLISKRIKRFYKSIPAYFSRMEENANKLIKSLQENIGNLNSILKNLEDPNIKEELNRAILIGNVEVEKYLRGDYF